jgi:hypothetical protein
VPPNHRLRRDDNEVLLPAGPNSPSNHLEELIEETEDRPRMVALQHRELLPKYEISRTRCRRLRNTTASAPNKRKSRLNMAPSYTRVMDGHSSKLLILRPARVLTKDRGGSWGFACTGCGGMAVSIRSL